MGGGRHDTHVALGGYDTYARARAHTHTQRRYVPRVAWPTWRGRGGPGGPDELPVTTRLARLRGRAARQPPAVMADLPS